MFSTRTNNFYFKVGSFLSVLILLGMATIFILGRESSVFESYTKIYTEISDAKMLKQGAAVMLKGIKVGRVEKMIFKDFNRIKVQLLIAEKNLNWIKTDAHIEILTQGVLGDKYLEITGGSASSESVKSQGFLTTKETNFISQVMNKGDDILNLSVSTLQKFDTFLGGITSNQEIFFKTLEETQRTATSARRIIDQIEPKYINTVLKELATTSRKLNKVLDQIEKGPGTMHSLIYDQGLHHDLRTVIGGAQRSVPVQFFIRQATKDIGVDPKN